MHAPYSALKRRCKHLRDERPIAADREIRIIHIWRVDGGTTFAQGSSVLRGSDSAGRTSGRAHRKTDGAEGATAPETLRHTGPLGCMDTLESAAFVRPPKG